MDGKSRLVGYEITDSLESSPFKIPKDLLYLETCGHGEGKGLKLHPRSAVSKGTGRERRRAAGSDLPLFSTHAKMDQERRGKMRKTYTSDNQSKFTPIEKQSKNRRKAFFSSQRGSWNGISPVTRVVQNRRVYDRKRMAREDRRITKE